MGDPSIWLHLYLRVSCSMVFSANDSPLSGRSGKAVTGRAIGARLMQEAESSVSLRVTPLPGGTEKYEVQVRDLAGFGAYGLGLQVWFSSTARTVVGCSTYKQTRKKADVHL